MDSILCECCGKNESFGVYGSTLGAVSFATCEDCILKSIEPYFMLEVTYDLCGSDVADHVERVGAYLDGEYISWADFVKMKEKP